MPDEIKENHMTKCLTLLQRLEASWDPVLLTAQDRDLLDSEVDDILKLIAGCNTVEAAEPFLVELGEIQDVMATLLYKHGVQLTKRQTEFVREYDRWDDPWLRRCAFQKIKSHDFPYFERTKERTKGDGSILC